MHTGMIFDLQRNSFVDGPGIRTTVFFKGCNLRCKWCHNPESQSPKPQIMFDPGKCTGCGRCKGVTERDWDFVCLHGAKKICGREVTVGEALRIIQKDKPFYDVSGGGVTCSGGECMLQLDFLCELLQACRKHHIHTAVDTAGAVPWASFERILPDTDLFLYDIKGVGEELHQTMTGRSNRLIFCNLRKLLESGANVRIRIPVIPTVNASVEEMKRIRDVLAPYRQAEVELLPYHPMGEHKYRALGLEMPPFPVPSEEMMKELREVFHNR